MRAGPFAASCLLLCLSPVETALAGSTTLSGNVTTERAPDDFAKTKGTDWGLGITHTFDNNFIIAANGKYYDTTRMTDYKVNIDASIGYTHDVGAFSLTFMAGIGQHFIESSEPKSFSYYFVTGALDIPLTKDLTWTALKIRYRKSFENAAEYDTPEVATGFIYWATDHTAVTLFIERDWADSEPAYNGIELGFKYRF